jgi:hypothetical protein
MTAAELTKLRLTLKANGYAPIPARGKEVLLVGWPAKTDASAAEIAGWAEQHPDWSNTGILTGNVCPVDLDIRDPEAAAACEDMLRDWFDGRGSLLTRFGAAPKRAILARTAHPFSKFHVDFIAPNASKHRIEVLGTGQQIVVHGIHPGTKKPYAWHGDRQPWSTPRDELPETDEAEMQQVVQLMSDMLVEKLGFVRKEDTPAPTGNGDSSPFVTKTRCRRLPDKHGRERC